MKTKILIGISLIIVALTACNKDDSTVLPTVETYVPGYIASSEIVIGCNVISDGGGSVICGLYMGLLENPESTGYQFQITSEASGLILGRIEGLTPDKQYYIKAYARNSKGESLGDEVMITTPPTITDEDNYEYKTVKIGDQVWMGENLKTTIYNNGESIGTTTPANLDITNETEPKYLWSYSDDQSTVEEYGRLYTWYAVTDVRGVCPTGWHIPTDADWTALETTLGGYAIAGSKLKESGNDHWAEPYNTDGSNESCFKALPGGKRDEAGVFSSLENYGFWWSSTENDATSSWIRSLYVQSGELKREAFTNGKAASVRCIKDN